MGTDGAYKQAIKRVFAEKYHDERMAVYWGRGAFSSYVIDDAMLAIIEYDSQLEMDFNSRRSCR